MPETTAESSTLSAPASPPAPQSSCQVIAFLSNKGGVAKTTNTSLLAEYLCLIRNKRVLIIDFDGQCNATSQWIGHELVNGRKEPIAHPDLLADGLTGADARTAITDIYDDKEVLPYDTPLSSEDPEDLTQPTVDLIPCSESGMQWIQETFSAEEDSGKTDKGWLLRGVSSATVMKGLHRFCRAPELQELYDYVLIDTGPGVNTLFRAVLAAANYVVGPYIPENFSVLGVGPLLHQIQEANNNRFLGGGPLEFLGLVPSKVDSRNPLHKEMMASLIEHEQLRRMHLPEGLFVPSSVNIARRSATNRPSQYPYSIFQMKPSDPVRCKVIEVYDYLYSQFNAGETTRGAVA